MVFCNTYFTEAAIELDASSVYRKYGTVAQFWLERWPVTPEVFCGFESRQCRQIPTICCYFHYNIHVKKHIFCEKIMKVEFF